MSEYYTVAVNSSTPVEITGGRVGNFVFGCTENFYLGELDVTSSNGVAHDGGLPKVHKLYVTSPDEVYLIISGDPTGTLKVFHCR